MIVFLVLFLVSFCCFVKQVLANGVDSEKDLHNFRDNKPANILEVQEWLGRPFRCYLAAPVQLEPHFQIGPDCYVGSTVISPSQKARYQDQETQATTFVATCSC